MNVTTEKVKIVKAPAEVTPDVTVEVKAEAKTEEKPSILEKLETVLTKLMGTYDGKYQEEEGVKGVPGTAEQPQAPEGGENPEGEQHDTKAEGTYDGKYQGDEEPDGDEDCDMEECTCEACGSKYQKKVAKKKVEEEEEEEEKKMEEEVLPKKAELAPAEVKPDLSVDAWRANFFTAAGIKPSKSAQDWMSACDSFTKTISKE